MEDYNKEHEQSEFNAGIATLQRLHEIKKWLTVSVVRDEPYLHYTYLRAFFKELAPMMTDEKEYQDEQWNKAKEYAPILKSGVEIEQEHLDFLDEWEIELRQIEQTKGMNIPKKTDARWALARR